MQDTTYLGNGGSPYATRTYDNTVPIFDVEDLFSFEVGFEKVFVPTPDGHMTEVPGRSAVVRTDNGKVLNIVSKRYGIHQFRDVLMENVSNLLDTGAGDLGVVGAGLLDHGGVGWVQIAPNDGVMVSGDKLAPTLTVVSSHNGKFATSYRTGLFRFRCSNQLGTVNRARGTAYRMRHTRNSSMNITDAREVLEVMFADTESAVTEVQRLIDQSVTDAQFLDIVRHLNPEPEQTFHDDGSVNTGPQTRWDNQLETLAGLWRNDPRVGFHGSAWGVVQTYSTYRQHERPYRQMTEVTRAGRNVQALLTCQQDKDDDLVVDAVRSVVGV